MPKLSQHLFARRSLLALTVFLCAFAFILGQRSSSLAQDKRKRPTSVDKVEVKAEVTPTDAANRQRITMKLNVADGWYIYANDVGHDDLQANATVVQVTGEAKPSAVKTKYPAGKKVTKFGATYRIYQGEVVLTTDVVRASGDSAPLRVMLRVSSCSKKGFCLPPSEIELNVPAYRK